MYRAEHERLEVYHRALAVVHSLQELSWAIPEYRHDLRDQLRRAATSIVFNLAEGANEWSAKSKANFYRMARRSAGECLAILDVIAPIVATPLPRELNAQLRAVMETLDKMAHAVLRRP